jgi:hypothetical protein
MKSTVDAAALQNSIAQKYSLPGSKMNNLQARLLEFISDKILLRSDQRILPVEQILRQSNVAVVRMCCQVMSLFVLIVAIL